METHAFKIYETGAPSMMKWEKVKLGKPGRGEVLLRHTAIGFNMVESYFRSGLYPLPGLPSGIGNEGSGVIEAVGHNVKGFKPGDRVCYSGGIPMGSYAEVHLIPAAGLIKLPAHVDEATAAAGPSVRRRSQVGLFHASHRGQLHDQSRLALRRRGPDIPHVEIGRDKYLCRSNLSIAQCSKAAP